MLTLLRLGSPMARYPLGDLPPDEPQQIEEARIFNHNLGREFEEELLTAYVVGRMREEDRVKFETNFLPSSEERMSKLEFARAWFEKGGFTYQDFTSPLHSYVLGDLTPEEEIEVEEKLLFDKDHQGQMALSTSDAIRLIAHGQSFPSSCHSA